MLTTILKQAVRNLIGQKTYLVIAITGLVIAFTVLLITAAYVSFESSYDRHQSKAGRIYRLSIEEKKPEINFYWHFARTWQTWRQKLPEFYPEIEALAEMRRVTASIKTDKGKFIEKQAFVTDSNAFKVFDFPLVEGDPNEMLQQKQTLVVSERLAQKLFPGETALNRQILLYGSYLGNFETYTITGVFRDMPMNSHFHAQMLIHYDASRPLEGNDFAYTYFLLNKNATLADIEKRVGDFKKVHVPEDQQQTSTLHFTKLTDIHLRSHIEREIEDNADLKQLKLLIGVAFALFIIALFNYINLSLAAFGKRQTNTKINQILGAKPFHIQSMVLVENLILTLIALIIALSIAKPVSKALQTLDIINSDFLTHNWQMPLAVVFMAVLLVITAGFVTALFETRSLSFFLISSADETVRSKMSILNKPILIAQFFIAMVVLTGCFMVIKQNNYMFSKGLGNGNENIIIIDRNFEAEEGVILLYKELLLENSAIEDVTLVMDPPFYLVKDARGVEEAEIPEENRDKILTILPSDDNFFSFFDIPIVAGNISRYIQGQSFDNYVLNEAAIKLLGYSSAQSAVGTRFKLGSFFENDLHAGTIVAVVKDFNFSSLYHPIEPTAFMQKTIWQYHYLVKIRSGKQSEAFTILKKTWDKVYPEHPFIHQYLSELYKTEYRKDRISFYLFSIFAVLCIVLSCIGLWGLSAIYLQRKTKEIGIRRVNGARVFEILGWLCKDILLWNSIAFILALPVAWYLMHKWLQNFAYKTELSWWVFALAGLIALCIALITVSWQSWRAAIRNPVESLRYE